MGASSSFAEKEGPSKWHGKRRHDKDCPWAGVRLTWLSEETAAHLKNVPKGFGRLVESVEPGSPAEEAGIQKHDVIWKLNDQLVVNSDQVATLLRHYGVGSEIVFTVSRGGENIQLSLTSGIRPSVGTELAENANNAMLPPGLDGPIRQVDLGSFSAFLFDGERFVEIVKTPEGFEFKITKEGVVKKEGLLAGRVADGEEEFVWPKDMENKTQEQLLVLVESLENAQERVRKPRIRRVPESKVQPRVRRVPDS